MKIKGKVTFQNLGVGFWGIIASDGTKYRAINMPEQLKSEGKQVTVVARKVKEDVSIFQWGTPISISGFHT